MGYCSRACWAAGAAGWALRAEGCFEPGRVNKTLSSPNELELGLGHCPQVLLWRISAHVSGGISSSLWPGAPNPLDENEIWGLMKESSYF